VKVYDECSKFNREQFDKLLAWHHARPWAYRPQVIRGELHAGSIFDSFLLREARMSVIDTVVFTGPDKALLDRTARMLDARAQALDWERVLDSKKRKDTKLEFDRLTRDARDLRALGVRLMKIAKLLKAPQAPVVSAVVPAGAIGSAAPVVTSP